MRMPDAHQLQVPLSYAPLARLAWGKALSDVGASWPFTTTLVLATARGQQLEATKQAPMQPRRQNAAAFGLLGWGGRHTLLAPTFGLLDLRLTRLGLLPAGPGHVQLMLLCLAPDLRA
jgi:hypothetical protein